MGRKKSYGVIYSGYETEDGETMSGAGSISDDTQPLDEFISFIGREFKKWLKKGLQKNQHKQFVLVIDFGE